MALNDFQIYSDNSFGPPGSMRAHVVSGTTSSINAGELVYKTRGSAYVVAKTASDATKPVVATDFIAGVAAATSTETTAANGTVFFFPNVEGMTYLGAPTVAATWNTQAKYDALVGYRVLINTAADGTMTVLAADGATSGLIVEPLDIAKYPNRVRFSLRQALNYTA
jgi:hypothetical protein